MENGKTETSGGKKYCGEKEKMLVSEYIKTLPNSCYDVVTPSYHVSAILCWTILFPSRMAANLKHLNANKICELLQQIFTVLSKWKIMGNKLYSFHYWSVSKKTQTAKYHQRRERERDCIDQILTLLV